MPTNLSDEITPLNGYCDDRFAGVAKEFAENFSSRNEVGAALAVYLQGEKVIDLWGGFAGTDKPWQEDTLCCTMSVTKAIATLAVLALIDEGLCKLEDPIAKYWPEFAQHGKDVITIEMLLSQLACLPVIDNADKDTIFNEQAMFEGLANQKPYWEPGSTPCYHSFTHGPLCQKLVYLLKNKSLGHYLREDVFKGYDIDVFIGLTDDEIQRCATITQEDNVPSFESMKQPDHLLGKAWGAAISNENLFNDVRFKKCEFASGNAHCTARGIAKLYSLLQGKNTLISSELLNNATQVRWDEIEAMTQRHFRYSAGFMLSNPCFYLGPSTNCFGHPGLGGSLGFCDPTLQVGFAYVCNHLKAVDHTGPNATALIDAFYQSLNQR